MKIHIYGIFVFRPSTKANITRWGLLAILRQPFAYFHTRDQLSLQQKKKSNIFISKHLKGQLGSPVNQHFLNWSANHQKVSVCDKNHHNTSFV